MESDQIVKEWRKDHDSRFNNFISGIQPFGIVLIMVAALLLLYLSKRSVSDPKFSFIIYAGLIAIIATLYFKKNDQPRLIPEDIAKKIAQEALNAKVREGKEFPFDSKLDVMPQCRLKYENDIITGDFSVPVAWDIGFVEKVHGTQFKREGIVSVQPFTGIVTGITWQKLGYTGNESKDRDIVPVGVVTGNMKTTDFGKPGNPIAS